MPSRIGERVLIPPALTHCGKAGSIHRGYRVGAGGAACCELRADFPLPRPWSSKGPAAAIRGRSDRWTPSTHYGISWGGRGGSIAIEPIPT